MTRDEEIPFEDVSLTDVDKEEPTILVPPSAIVVVADRNNDDNKRSITSKKQTIFGRSKRCWIPVYIIACLTFLGIGIAIGKSTTKVSSKKELVSPPPEPCFIVENDGNWMFCH